MVDAWMELQDCEGINVDRARRLYAHRFFNPGGQAMQCDE